jgi:hypothetical protein
VRRHLVGTVAGIYATDLYSSFMLMGLGVHRRVTLAYYWLFGSKKSLPWHCISAPLLQQHIPQGISALGTEINMTTKVGDVL